MIVGVDMGATTTRIGYVKKGEVYEKRTLSTPKRKHEILSTLSRLIDLYEKKSALCLGIAAFMHEGRAVHTPNMDFSDVSLASILTKRYRQPVYVDNDADCAGLGELVYGHGKGRKNFVLLTLGTGIGGAIIINGELYRGSSFAGEVGQIIIEGKRLEERASGTAARKLAPSYGLAGYSNYGIEVLSKKGDRRALNLYQHIGTWLGLGLLNISYVVDPEVFIIGGGFSHARAVLERAQRTLQEKDVIGRGLKVLHAYLGDNAGLIGASLLPQHYWK